MEKLVKTYTKKERNMYLAGMLGQNVIYCIISTGLTYYFQSVIFIPAIAMSILMAAARIWDAVNDPMMGTIVDRTRSKYGKCRPYLMVAPSIIFVTTMLTFCNGRYGAANTNLQNGLIIAWAAVSYILWGMSYTVGDIPLWGITSLMTNNEKDRSNILALSQIMAGIGGGIVMLSILNVSQILGNHLGEKWNDNAKGLQWGFIIIALLLSVFGTVLFQCAAYTKERVKQPSDEHKGFVDNIKIMWSCKPYRRILISGVLRGPINILAIVAMTLLSYYFGDNGQQDYYIYLLVLGGGLFAGQFVSTAFTPKLAEKFEKRKLYRFFCAASSVPFVLIFLIYLADGTALFKPYWVAVLCLLFTVVGIAMGAIVVLQSIMIADCVDYDEYETGYRPDGIFFSGQCFIAKIGSGISSLIQGAVFAAVGFSGQNMAVCNDYLFKIHQQSASVKYVFATSGIVNGINFPAYRLGLFLLVSLPSALGCLLSIIPMKKYELSNERSSDILKQLNLQREAREISESETDGGADE